MGNRKSEDLISLYFQLFKLAISICICLAVGAIGGLFSENPGPAWYPPLTKPLWVMPLWFTSVIWGIIYVLMGAALGLVWISPKKNKQRAFWAFGAQLFLVAILNFVWSQMLFYLENPLLNLTNIGLLLIMILLTMSLFWKYSHWATFLLVPYALWVLFAMIRNLYLWIFVWMYE